MQKSDCFELGYIAKSHGLEGKLQAIFDVEDLTHFIDVDSVFLEVKNNLVPFFVEDIVALDAKKVLLKLEEIDTKDLADELKGTKIFLPTSFLPTLEEGRFYYHDIIGYQVEDSVKGDIGIVKEFVDAGLQVIMVVMFGDKEILIPFHDDFLVEVSHSDKIIKLKLPGGLVDLYLESAP